jgi:predicted PurR-regulated permease PerM
MLMIAGVPYAGVLAMVTLLFGIVQVPALIVTLPVIAYIWTSGDYATGRRSCTPCCSASRGCWTTS